MSIEQAIHTRWSSWRPLTELVPTDRFVTGWLPASAEGTPNGSAAYVLLERGAQRTATRTSGERTLLNVLMRFYVRAERLALAKQLASEIQRRFDRQAFQTDETHVQDMKRINYRQQPRRDGAWQIVLEYLTRAEE